MLDSPDFKATPQQIAFLKFVVNQTLAGNASQIKGYTVATQAFGRGPDFDQSIDPVLSIQAGRPRRSLERYYLTPGMHDPVRIDIPKGTYKPTFSEQLSIDPHPAAEKAETVEVMANWPTILIQPLANLSENPEDNYFSISLTAELAHALSHYREIRVLEVLHRDPDSAPPETHIFFLLMGMFDLTRRVSR